MFLLCDDDLLLQTDVSPSNKLMGRSRTDRGSVSTLRRWSVAATGAESLKEIDGQVANRRRKCFYFAMMIRCCWWISVLQGHLGKCREPKEKLFLLCDDDPLLLMDLRPSRTFTDKSRTEGENREAKEKIFLLCDDDPFLKTHGFIYLLKLVVVRLHIRINFKNYDTSFFCFVVDFLIW